MSTSKDKILSYCIGEESGSCIFTDNFDDFVEYLRDKVAEAEDRGQEHFDITIENTEC